MRILMQRPKLFDQSRIFWEIRRVQIDDNVTCRFNPPRRISSGPLCNSRKCREQNQLNMSGPVDAAFRSISRTENTIRADADVLELCRAARREPLTKPIPIIVNRNAGLISVDKYGDPLPVLVGCDDQMIGV
jgi:hypothetical protein